MTRRLLTLLIAVSFAAIAASVAAICRDLARLFNDNPAEWRE